MHKQIIGAFLLLSFGLFSAGHVSAADSPMKVKMLSSTATIETVVSEDGSTHLVPMFKIYFTVKAIGSDIYIPPFFTDAIEGDSVYHLNKFDVYKDGSIIEATEETSSVGFGETYDLTPESTENHNRIVHAGTTKEFYLLVLAIGSQDTPGDYFMKIMRLEWSTTDADFNDEADVYNVKHFTDVPFQTGIATL